MQISRTVLYALQASVVLSKFGDSEPIPCKTLSQHGQMPERFLVQVLRCLVNHGVLHSIMGSGGGYILARPASEISLMQIVEAVDNPLEPKLPLVPGIAHALRERVQSTMSKSMAAGRVHLESVTLADLARATPAESIAPAAECTASVKHDPPGSKGRKTRKNAACA